MLRSFMRGGAATALVLGLAGWPAGAGMAQTAAPVPLVVPAPSAAPAAVPAPAVAPAPVVSDSAAVSPAAAATLANTIDAGLRQWLPIGGAKSGWKWSGKPQVTPAGDHYDVGLPSLSLVDDDGSSVKVGIVKMTMAPLAGGAWQVGMTVPSQMQIIAADGKPDGELTIGSQRFSGRWLPSLGIFTAMDGEYGAVTAASKKDTSRLEIASLIAKADTTEKPAGLWSGPGTFAASGVVMTDEHGVELARVGRVAVETVVTGMDLAGLVKAGSNPEIGRHPEMLRGLLGGVSGKLIVSDATVTSPGDGNAFSIKEISTHGGIEGLSGEQTSISFGYGHSGLKLNPSPAPAEFTPDRVKLDLAVSALPNAKLWAAVEALLKPPAPEQTEDTLSEQFSQAVLAALSEAGSRVSIKALDISAPISSAEIKGDATFDSKAAFGMVAGVDMVVRDLEAAIKTLQPAPGTKADEDTQKTLATLGLIQALGVPGKDAAGRDTRTYKFSLGGDGKVMLNGTDMSAIIQGFEGPSHGPADKP